MMKLWKRLRGLLIGEKSAPLPPLTMREDERDDEQELVTPEITAEQLRSALAESVPPYVIDVREEYEWRLVRMRAARHIPMNDIPAHLDTIPRERAIVVMCAHGSRSYGVAAWLIEQGYQASSLAGGITQWASQGGEVMQGAPQQE
jgi:rhodanese-related sulfurtransferase